MSVRASNASTKSGLQSFRRLRLENWRNFVRVDVPLAERVFLIGPNASGKSNLLDAFEFLHELTAVGGGLQKAVARRGGVSRLRSFAARRVPELSISVDLVGDAGTEWSYELRFTQNKQARAVIRRETVARDGERVLDRPNDEDRADPERLTQTYLEQVQANQAFRDVADFFGSIRYLHIVPQLVREPDRSLLRQEDPYGSDFLESIARMPGRTRDARLRRIGEALTVAIPQLSAVEMTRDERGAPHLRGRYEHWRPQGAWLTEAQFSDGTLRLMGLLWALLEGSGPLLLEEPELSLHAEVVRLIPQLFARAQRRQRRQIIVSTHSPELLTDPGIGVDEVLILRPQAEGTLVTTAGLVGQVTELVSAGLSLAEAAMPLTRPPTVEQLTLFG